MAPSEWAKIEGDIDVNDLGDDLEIIPSIDGPQWVVDAIDRASESKEAREWAEKLLADRSEGVKAAADDARYHQQVDDGLTRRHGTGR